MTLLDDTDRLPDSVNEEGTKWWFDKNTTDYARRPNSNGTTLDDVMVFIVETKDGYRTRLLVEKGEIIWEGQKLEAACGAIDIMKVNKVFPNNGQSS